MKVSLPLLEISVSLITPDQEDVVKLTSVLVDIFLNDSYERHVSVKV